MRFQFAATALFFSAACAQYSGLNVTPITGTWSSGSQRVLTGDGFANPANMTFNYPATTGISYSFTDDMFYEISRYRFNGNGSQPTCITGVLNWVHGTYQFLSNGSILMTPMGDGFQQIQDACAAQSNFVEFYNDTELYLTWNIVNDPSGGFKLYLFQFDGTQLAPMGQVSSTPNMLPTQLLRNVTTSQFTSQNGFVSTGSSKKASSQVLSVSKAERVVSFSTAVAGVLGAAALAMTML
ncbi:hypothetical protein SCHPADRAFT_837024 [Schizopora paradoxa]|uniref:Protein ROT1 n=1 Tax=Schizopora paradoxa TaxID=27342 RepID=A0A0H2R5W1_9AGAM|nr:hypothetical protein SCHPADRAFT_837024 [Schizopora paradoxa]